MSPTTTHASDDLLGLTEPKEGYTHICALSLQKDTKHNQ